MLMTPCPRAHLGPGWPGSWMRTPRRSSAGRSPANMCECSWVWASGWGSGSPCWWGSWAGAGSWALPSSAVLFVRRMDQEFSRRLSMSEVKDDNAAKTLSAAARRSFFRRKHKHKRSGSKDGKDLLALDTFSNDSIPLFEGKWLGWLLHQALRMRFVVDHRSLIAVT